MSKQVEFGEIDFEAIEYRNEYRHSKKVLAGLVTEALFSLSYLWWVFGDSILMAMVAIANIAIFAFATADRFIQRGSRVLITGQSLILKRPLLKDVEIAYSEIGEVRVNNIVIREGSENDFLATDLSEARRIWDLERINGIQIRSRDGKKKIYINQLLENFERFCNDLAERRRLAIDRYEGYAKGTCLRQPERHLKARETLEARRSASLAEKK
jgi:hypothetical protein